MIARSKRTIVGVLLGILVLGAGVLDPPAARAADTLDQQQAQFDDYGFARWNASSGRVAQTFTAGMSGTLSRVRLMLGTDGTSGSVTVQITDTSAGLPVHGALASATIPATGLPGADTLGWVDIAFAAPARVTIGQEYAIVVGHDISEWLYWGGSSSSDVYAGGAPVWDSYILEAWVPLPGRDLVFETYVERTPPSAQFLEPLTQSTSAGTVVNTAKNGRIVPVKVLLRGEGAPLTDANVAGPVTLSVVDNGACDGGAVTDPVDVYAAGSSSSGDAFRYDAGSGAWIYNLDMKAMRLKSGHCYRLGISVSGVPVSTAWAILAPLR